MPLRLGRSDWRAIFPDAPQTIIDAFTDNPGPLDRAGITATRTRLSYALANVEHECGGFTIGDLTENIRYTAARMAAVWPNRFSSEADVKRKYGTASGWQKKAFDDIYGGRMGNRRGTTDGSTYIGRGGPQVTGRDGYRQVGSRCDLDLVADPELAASHKHQPAILAAFWSWKQLNELADAGNFTGCIRRWNGGLNGERDRRQRLSGNDPIIRRLSTVATIMPTLDRVG